MGSTLVSVEPSAGEVKADVYVSRNFENIANLPDAKFRAKSPCQTGLIALYSRTRASNPYRRPAKIAYNLGVLKVIHDGAFEPAATHAASRAVLRQWRGLGSQQV